MEIASNVRDFLVGMKECLSLEEEQLLACLQELHQQYIALMTDFARRVSELALSMSPEARMVAHELRVRIYQDWRARLMERIFTWNQNSGIAVKNAAALPTASSPSATTTSSSPCCQYAPFPSTGSGSTSPSSSSCSPSLSSTSCGPTGSEPEPMATTTCCRRARTNQEEAPSNGTANGIGCEYGCVCEMVRRLELYQQVIADYIQASTHIKSKVPGAITSPPSSSTSTSSSPGDAPKRSDSVSPTATSTAPYRPLGVDTSIQDLAWVVDQDNNSNNSSNNTSPSLSNCRRNEACCLFKFPEFLVNSNLTTTTSPMAPYHQ